MNIQHFIFALLNILNEMSPYILLGFLIAGLLHVFVRPETMSRHLAGHGWKPVLKAALFGIPLPLCSCGVLPTAVSLRRQSASKGATTSFLIATPQTGVDSITATYALLGLPFAIVRPVAALFGAFAGGMAVDRFDRGRDSGDSTLPADTLHHSCADGACCTPEIAPASGSFIHKLIESVRYGMVDMVGSVGKWLVIGLLIAAVITVAVPSSLFLSLKAYPLAAMLVMVAVAVPMYICATGSIPIALSLMLKGLSPGTAFVLLMAGPAANFASVMVLGKAMGRRATGIYVGSVIVTAILFGLIIDYCLPAAWFAIPAADIAATQQCHLEAGWFASSCSLVLIALLACSAVTGIRNRRRFRRAYGAASSSASTCTTSETTTDMQTIYIVKGMQCTHCKASVEKAIAALPGVTAVTADLASGKVAVEGTAAPEAVAAAVSAAGFDFAGKA